MRKPQVYAKRIQNEQYRREQAQRIADWKAKHPESARTHYRVSQRRRRAMPEHSAKFEARRLVRNAIRRGDLIRKPCHVCGNVRSEAHHPDYSKPLDVSWLCRVHHNLQHRSDVFLAIVAPCIQAEVERDGNFRDYFQKARSGQ